MRRGNNPCFAVDDQGKTIGVNLGSDFVSEHEWGIAGIMNAFSIDANGLGFDRYVVKAVPHDRVLYRQGTVDGKKAAVLIFSSRGTIEYLQEKRIKDIAHACGMYRYNEEGIAAAWDEREFGILAVGLSAAARLKDIYDAFKDNDLAIGFADGSTPFSNPGLLIQRKSTVPQEEIDEMMEADLDYRKMLQVAAKTGIDAKLRAAGKRWYALSPKWTKEVAIKTPTKYDVVFWLNPWEQDKNHAGWFTVEELEAWMKGEGPIPKR